MIESAIREDLIRITGLKVFPLLLPQGVYSGITYQRISDPEVDTGLLRTSLIAGRFQITIYIESDYTQLVKLDAEIWKKWREIQHGLIADYPVQYVRRASLSEGKETLTGGTVLYSRTRDYIITFAE
ncbi:hypothetical protein B7L51_003805 [Pectobacterium brasiliense]|uniref:hypothetical protein n=1 Tax=Pectobacterium brasiliense TaxID=180957 RepID=UPI000B969A80|nr:hypothetical protein [Pectobacterium carotovorum]OYN52646.1 hypothetical protein B7L51_03840 [Pectobacterium carotovorum]